MTPKELTDLIKTDEGQNLEFKVESEKKINLAVVLQGFAHAEGGKLLVGVSDDKIVLGVSRVKTIVDRIKQAASMLNPSLLPYLKIWEVTVKGKIVVGVDVPQVPNEIFDLGGSYHVRQGSFTVGMRRSDLKDRLMRSGQVSIEKFPVPLTTVNDIDENRFYQYLEKRTQMPGGVEDLKTLLRRAGCLANDGVEERPTVMSLMLFGKNPQDIPLLFHSRLKAARFAGTVPLNFIDEEDISGPIPVMIEKALNFASRNMRHPLIINPPRTGTAQAIKIDEYPETALREALVNSLCHRDYYIERPNYLKIFDDRIEIENPGGLHEKTSLEEVRGFHITRNPNIARALHTLSWIEQFGTGLYRMEQAMLDVGLHQPTYTYDRTVFRVTLWGPGQQIADMVEAGGVMPLGETAKERELKWLLERIGGEQKLAVRQRQAKATLHIRNNGTITRAIYVKLNKIKPYAARDELHDLVVSGVLKLSGWGKSSFYRLTEYKLDQFNLWGLTGVYGGNKSIKWKRLNECHASTIILN